MKPAGKGPLDSLYFDYPHFPFRAPAAEDGDAARVLIAGAGPVGLVAALALARAGVRSVVLDDKDTLNDGSRAICLSRHSIETFAQLGVAEPFLAKALGWTHGRCYYRDREFYRLEMPHSAEERFLPMYNIQQQYIERYLVEAAQREPEFIDLRWQSRVATVQQDAAGVTLGVETPAGAYGLRGDWLLAADGARSAVRRGLGLSLAGTNLSGDYVIADVRMRHDFPTERRAFFNCSARPQGTVLIHRQPDDIWRLDYQLDDDEDREEAVREDRIRDSVERILAMIGHDGPWELEWWSIYTANTLCLDDYRHGRVLFIGDSAHIVPIFGVRGLNNGIADALNAAWKLACVVQGRATGALLDSYSPERRGATLDVFANAGRSARFMTPPTRGHALLREAALELALTQEFPRRLADPRQVQPYTYAGSALTSQRERDDEFTAGPPAGSPLPNARLGEQGYLLDHLGSGFSAVYFRRAGADDDDVRGLFEELGRAPWCVRLVDVAGGDASHGSRPAGEPADAAQIIADADGHLARTLDAVAGSFYLVRPDRYIAARWRRVVPDEVRHALRIAHGESA